jgi:hypothetical protein
VIRRRKKKSKQPTTVEGSLSCCQLFDFRDIFPLPSPSLLGDEVVSTFYEVVQKDDIRVNKMLMQNQQMRCQGPFLSPAVLHFSPHNFKKRVLTTDRRITAQSVLSFFTVAGIIVTALLSLLTNHPQSRHFYKESTRR